jgi:hypothetical protein
MIAYTRDKTTAAGIRAACIFGLAQGLEHSRPDVPLDERGYVPRAEDNLLPGQTLDQFSADLQAGAGKELLGKFRAVHSSAALAVNCFAPLRAGGVQFDLAGQQGLEVEGFERRFPTGLARAQPPHLDVVASGPGFLVAIESKCLEYLSPTKATFSDRYRTEIVDERAAGPWYAEMLRLVAGKSPGYRWLDAAQLIKHAFGLAYRSERPTTLVYLFWEPMDAGLSQLFGEHRQEIAEFAERVAGGTPKFEALSYYELWERWADSSDPRLTAHVAALRTRYEIPAWAWEMVEWKDGRLQSADWMMDLIEEVDAEREAARAEQQAGPHSNA